MNTVSKYSTDSSKTTIAYQRLGMLKEKQWWQDFDINIGRLLTQHKGN